MKRTEFNTFLLDAPLVMKINDHVSCCEALKSEGAMSRRFFHHLAENKKENTLYMGLMELKWLKRKTRFCFMCGGKGKKAKRT